MAWRWEAGTFITDKMTPKMKNKNCEDRARGGRGRGARSICHYPSRHHKYFDQYKKLPEKERETKKFCLLKLESCSLLLPFFFSVSVSISFPTNVIKYEIANKRNFFVSQISFWRIYKFGREYCMY